MPIPSYLLDQKEREIQQALSNLRALPTLTRAETSNDDACPICLLSLESILSEHEEYKEGQEGSSDLSSEGLYRRASEMTGVVKLSGCGHVFCRKDLAEWIESHHGSCPTCRQTFFPFTPIDETDYESSDGGEYVPDEDEEDDMFTDDGEIELVATSDIDYDTDLDDIHPDEEGPDVEGLGYAPLARVLAAANAEAEANARRRERAARVYIPHDTSEFRVSAHGDDGNEVADDEFVNDVLDFDAPGALSFGSDSPSSEGTSVGNEVRPGHLTTNVELASMHDGIEGGSDVISANIDQSSTKSPSGQESGSSNGASKITHAISAMRQYWLP